MTVVYTGDVLARFYDKVIPVETGCHIWRSRLNERDKPGHLRIKGKSYLAYRISLELKLGRPIAPGMQGNHTCDVRACVNPEHLYEGSQLENVADAMNRGRWVAPPPPDPNNPPPISYGESNPSAVMTAESVGLLRNDRLDGLTYSALAKKYNISASTVAQIVTGKTWKGVISR